MRFRTWLVALCAVVTLVGVPRTARAQLGARPAEEPIKTLEAADRIARLKIAEIKLFDDKCFVIYGRR